MLNRNRVRRWRLRHQAWVRSLQFELQDMQARLEHRDGIINMLRHELRYRNQRNQFGSWLIGKGLPPPDGDPPSNPNCS
jgi:hypothetical protein